MSGGCKSECEQNTQEINARIVYGPQVSDLILQVLPDSPEEAIHIQEIRSRVNAIDSTIYYATIDDALGSLRRYKMVDYVVKWIPRWGDDKFYWKTV